MMCLRVKLMGSLVLSTHQCFFLLFDFELQLMISASDYMMLKLRGYEYDAVDNCIIERKANGQEDRCRQSISVPMH